MHNLSLYKVFQIVRGPFALERINMALIYALSSISFERRR